MREHELQKQIVDALVLAGFEVLETTAYRQKGPTGVDKGIPDLLVSTPILPFTFLGIEVKLPGSIKWSSKEQERLHQAGRFVVSQSPYQALVQASEWLHRFGHSWPFTGEIAEYRARQKRADNAVHALEALR